ncbi:preprotein translocase subunit : Protein translocase subunit SecY OS=Planctomyces maris DSM 8797 GN=secY PE=3 SV=1: SecY [Gemmata massiliana]|uniref:Protein translocase subunit SecY n=1 Tax=Gemmata massiliana TaxID=1210884 RepID=A0A6P2DHX7_9BACT|nr:preprotein translocase subunit SecY [Gemmata massiliana]VTR99559.1 preprotein translocase subunit : Protein translocase subunit SecY OS=Planctomyces maris DSM 8797 GN=secY PE=3 SV=1: SecY [Gemmata massiliana]
MNWRSICLAAGIASLVGGLVTFSYGGESWLGWTLTIFGAAASILGFVPDQLLTIFKIPELRKKIFITLIFLAVYRIGYYVPLPMIDQAKMAEKMADAQRGALGQVLGFVSLFSGGNLSNACIFSLGIMPYISASIIVQLLSSGVVPSLEKLRKEGESGRKKLNEITRYLTVPICIIQAIMVVQTVMKPDTGDGGGMGLAPTGYNDGFELWWFGFTAVITLTAGTVLLMWLGEQIDEYGIGNGISLIIMAGIVARIPDATNSLLIDSATGKLKDSVFTLGGGSGADISLEKLIVLAFLFVTVVVGVIAMTKAQRRIPTQSAKHVRGRRVYGGTRQFLPMKVNAAGVMPVIFASTLLILPWFFFNAIYNLSDSSLGWAGTLSTMFQNHRGWLYNFMYVIMIYVFTYFWVAITFNPKEIADNLKDHGSFIPGYRPGKKTADYLERVLMRVTFVGAAFLAIIAIIPNVISSELEIPVQVASFYGGTGLLIVISVALDLVQKINSHLVMRNYPSLTDET